MAQNKNDDEIDFLLSNVNDSSSSLPKKPLTTSYETTENHESTPKPQNEPVLQDEALWSLRRWNFDSPDKGPVMVYLIAGLVTMILLGIFIIVLGVFVSTPAILFLWFFGWFIVCCGGFWCIARRPKAIHICNGATVGLIFGILAMVSFSIVRDIVLRPEYGPIDVTAVPDFDPTDGSIIYFGNGAPMIQYLGEASVTEDPDCDTSTEKCAMMFYCVAPIIDATNFNINTSVADYWVGCQVAAANEDCASSIFTGSDCYKSWNDAFVSGFAFGTDGRVAQAMLLAVENATLRYHLIVSGGPSGNFSNWNSNSSNLGAIVVLWSPDPQEEAAVFWTSGWLLVAAAPMVYCIFGLVYSLICRQRFKREEYEVIE